MFGPQSIQGKGTDKSAFSSLVAIPPFDSMIDWMSVLHLIFGKFMN